MTRSANQTLAAALSICAFLAPAPAEAAAPLEVKATEMQLLDVMNNVKKPAPLVVEEGLPVAIECSWSVGLADLGDQWGTSKMLPFDSLFQVDGKTIQVFTPNLMAGLHLGQGGSSSGGFSGESKNTGGLTLVKGTKLSSTTWIAKGVGAHEAKCVIDYQGVLPDGTNANNTVIGVIQVVAAKSAAAPAAKTKRMNAWKAGAAPAKAAGGPVLAQPSLQVVGVTPKIDQKCAKPGHPLVASVQIRNSGVPLPAAKGHVSISEVWGANLKSANVALPAFGANQVKVVQIPVEVQSVSIPSLPGPHKLNVDLAPLSVAGSPAFGKPDLAYVFSVSFPSGYCQSQPRTGTPPKRSN